MKKLNEPLRSPYVRGFATMVKPHTRGQGRAPWIIRERRLRGVEPFP